MAFKRIIQHIFAPSADRIFSKASLQAITDAITASEQQHEGEIVFAVESQLSLSMLWQKLTARARGWKVFAQLGVWDTENNNGVLIYLLLAEHRIEILADRGLDSLVSTEQWQAVCAQIEMQMQAGKSVEAILAGVQAISTLLTQHYPRNTQQTKTNELTNQPHIL